MKRIMEMENKKSKKEIKRNNNIIKNIKRKK
jgi:hypothetical protein